MMEQPLVAVRDLRLQFRTYAGIVHALNGIDLEIREQDMLGLVGETGCGKSMTGLAILRLVPQGGEVVSGSVLFRGEELLTKSESEMQRIRGARIAMVFQDPATSLNPLFTIGEQIETVMQRHKQAKKHDLRDRALKLLETVELPDPARILDTYPHELSGGMKQRASIAIALSCGADLVIADEPTTDLDVTVQAQILDLLRRLRETQGVAVLMITHDLAVVAETCQRVAVLYAGQVVESGPVDEVLFEPKHPYTRALLQASPKRSSRGRQLRPIAGTVPSGLQPLQGCSFGPRCPQAMEICLQPPQKVSVTPAHVVYCFLYDRSEEK
jgi:oligopeptide/dipeptide ABC transporter ATP-binding protein